ncbi:Tat (twin-arginine translocation) pathway signal sequence [Granulicella pectinivorans]|jgi:predicted dehydrogenase|uniref:Tat (Twin-arginine translocation) pathway signal sequence n=1 Tax=Granulicella pectinivorans TaxID=474950 RepID=A0A1I6M044_9BACT|nr:twin-arginine translocation signal domain-containing protein [Granulicella pectinivorans]SFS09079.1 Tat (twin-arginine translocation) pathway signal sequence [Granulicella pectinivorans]
MNKIDAVNRRAFLKTAGLGAGMLASLPASSFGEGHIIHETVAPSQDIAPTATLNFAVCGMSHDHIYGMVGAIQRGGGKLVAWFGEEPDKIALFKSRFPDVKQVMSEQAILDDPNIQLVLSSTVASHRAQRGVRVMKHGKDYLSDKPGITTLADLADIRATIASTKRIYGIMYSELLEVKGAIKAGELVRAGAIGKVIQTINIAPHQIEQGASGDKFAGGASKRPDWFWKPELYGGILCDIGSHQVEQFLYYTGSTSAEIVESQVANINHPGHPAFQDFGDMVLRGDKGFGYVRLDWFTPDGLGTWGDGRLFILGTQGYIEVRKYTNVAVNKSGNNLFIVDKDSSRYIDCNNVPLPFGPQFVADCVNRTHIAQDQTQALLAAELVIKAQLAAKHVTIKA